MYVVSKYFTVLEITKVDDVTNPYKKKKSTGN